jgi:hypothetical protein
LTVIQTYFDCKIADRGILGLAWFEARVNRAGHVVRARVLHIPGDRWTSGKIFREVARYDVASLRRWRFAPLIFNGHRTGFHIVLVGHFIYWKDLPITKIYQGRSRRFMPCVPMDFRDYVFTGRMPRWVLYPLKGHRPLAVLLAYGNRPVPGIAQATAYVLRRLENKPSRVKGATP